MSRTFEMPGVRFDLTHFTPTTLAAMAADLEGVDRTYMQSDLLDKIIEMLAANVGK